MKKILCILLCSAFCFANGYASSDSLQISLITCGNGAELYASFGHSALRVKNLSTGNDQVYNFGMFDASTPYFPFKFLQGTAEYQLGIQSFDEFLGIYKYEKRTVEEQVLNLTQEEKNQIIKQLNYLYLPENRSYFYRFEADNCTSALRDLIFNAIHSSNKTKFQQPTSNTFRQLINECLAQKTWLAFGMNLLLGANADKDLTYSQSLFLPDLLKNEIDKTEQDGYKLVKEEQGLHFAEQKECPFQKFFSPLIVFSLLLLLTLFFKSDYLRSSIFIIAGLLGVLMLIISLSSEHPELKNNFNILWASPLYLLSVIFARQKNIQKYFAYSNLALTATSVALWITGVQTLPIAFIPLILALGVCNVYTLKGVYVKNKPIC